MIVELCSCALVKEGEMAREGEVERESDGG